VRRRGTWLALIALGLAAPCAAVARRSASWKTLISVRYPDIRWVDSETLASWMDGAVPTELVLLDVRTAEEQEVSQLRGARRVDPVNPNIQALAIAPDATVVVYCSIGYRSAAIVEDLKHAGVRNVYNLEGGLFEWANRDHPVFRDEKQVHEVHPFNRVWGLFLRRDLRASE